MIHVGDLVCRAVFVLYVQHLLTSPIIRYSVVAIISRFHFSKAREDPGSTPGSGTSRRMILLPCVSEVLFEELGKKCKFLKGTEQAQ